MQHRSAAGEIAEIHVCIGYVILGILKNDVPKGWLLFGLIGVVPRELATSQPDGSQVSWSPYGRPHHRHERWDDTPPHPGTCPSHPMKSETQFGAGDKRRFPSASDPCDLYLQWKHD